MRCDGIMKDDVQTVAPDDTVQAAACKMREHNLGFVPFYLEGVAGNPTLNISDGLHPNPAGARIVEQTVWRALERAIEKHAR